MPKRFVILHHTGCKREHWDLMLESTDALWTWQLSQNPTTHAQMVIEAVRIGDHRKHYLDYEGSISGDRGEVQRVDDGEMEWVHADDENVTAKLTGRHLSGVYQLTRTGTGRWRFESAP